MIVENAGDRDTMVILMETVPWYLRTFYHTIALKIVSKGACKDKPRAALGLYVALGSCHLTVSGIGLTD